MKKFIKKQICLLLSAIMLFFAMPITANAVGDSTEVDYTHNLLFASDLRGEDSAFEDSFRNDVQIIDYYSLIGDVVGSDEPSYSIDEKFYGPLVDLFGGIPAGDESVISGDHDKNAVDESGKVLKCKNGEESEEIFKEKNSDGSMGVYVYSVGYNDMCKGGQQSYEAAEAFKHWVKKKDPTIPIIVVSHVPVQALRGDNLGAAYWNEALNFAATGVEEIIGEGDLVPIKRNVVFLCGHNCTADTTEYMFKAGSKMPVQIDTSIDSGRFSEDDFNNKGIPVTTSDVNDTEYEDTASVKAKSVKSDIYYTSFVPGYMKANRTSTVLMITENNISFVKYHMGNKVSLGTDGATGDVLGLTETINRIKDTDENGPKITSQPEDTIVSYPDGATFSVQVEEPENITSYQWYMLDSENSKFELSGASAHTDTLVVPSTLRMNGTLRFYCRITDKNGLKSNTRQASLELNNYDEYKPVLYVGEYPVQPGETLDLGTVNLGDGYKLGSGTITYDQNATDITFTNVDFDNTHTTADLATTSNVGISLEYFMQQEKEYNITFVGENRIFNSYYDADYNMSGIPFDFYFNGEGSVKPVVNFIGDGTLKITNGTYAARVIGDLMIDIDVTVDQSWDYYGDGIVADNILVDKGRKLDLRVNGSAFIASNNLFMDNAEVNIDSHIPRVSVGTATKNIISCHNTFNLINTKLNMNVFANESVCEKTAGNTLISVDNELFMTQGCDVSATFTAQGTSMFISAVTGVSTDDLYIENSKASVKIDTDRCVDSIGLYVDKSAELINSDVNISAKTNGTVYGTSAEKEYNINDSNLKVIVENYGDYPEFLDYGFVAGKVNFALTNPNKTVSASVDKGIAFACDLEKPIQENPEEYVEGYTPERIILNNVDCTVPENSAISVASTPVNTGEGVMFAAIETVYDKDNTTAPAVNVEFRAHSHKMTLIPAKKATYTATGNNAYYYCQVCKKCFKDAAGKNATTPKAEVIKKLAKKKNTLKVKGRTIKVKAKTFKKKKKVTFKRAKAITVKDAKGKVAYKKVKGNKKILVAKNGNIVVKKGLKKGTYKIKVSVTASGTAAYKKLTKTVIVTVKVK